MGVQTAPLTDSFTSSSLLAILPGISDKCQRTQGERGITRAKPIYQDLIGLAVPRTTDSTCDVFVFAGTKVF